MRLLRWFSSLALIAAVSAGCGDDPAGGGDDDVGPGPDASSPGDPDAAPIPDDILEYLQSLDGMTVEEIAIEDENYRFFLLTYEQPADHDDPNGVTFPQQLTLMHRDRNAPMVLHTSGYYGSTRPSRAELTRMLDANQIRTEQRFFLPSRPDPADWATLTIEQAANDHHRIVEALQPYYNSGAWLATGASKGGMTSVYHRRFFPDDLDAVVAYVAPLSFGENDARYVDFLANVGDADCRDKLVTLQREALTRREAMLTRLDAAATQDGLTFDIVGKDGALEGAVIELPFAFWQYFGAQFCSSVPGAGSTDDQIYQWLDFVASVTFGADQGIEYYQPYYYQAFTQLGYPGVDTTAIDDLLTVGEIEASQYLPAGVEFSFDAAAMPDVADWVSTEGSELMFIYGENDPWTAGAFDLGNAQDSFLFTVPAGTHGANIEALPADQRQQAVDVLERWTGVTPMFRARRAGEPAEPRFDMRRVFVR